MYAVLAEALVALHLCIVLFMILGFLGILIGWPLGWRWIRNPCFRWAHLAIMTYIVISTLNDELCFLTHWEAALRQKAGQVSSEEGSFFGRMLHDLVYVDVSRVWLARAYYVLGALFLIQWIFIRPRTFRVRKSEP